ncbi:thiolase family protein [Prosthecomicrobium hirschii]|uniref:Beta-ketothiolase n=1 Tax=Prosthecodimorpha hirschii TaxID=665126 RepID=A0A0P6W1E8_9HYPH|nr:thiolase family protein [Prosthecomicrobium hirschii]KPL51990.1 acetyl-CoA acetyltransferase [Prosthecomicrobium hirschii]MCW1843649.1 thiolase family protein [Prosthecomicrobium hirschii]
MTRAVIAGYVRSPFTPARRGALASVRADDLMAAVIRALIERSGIPADAVEDVLVGCAFPEAEQGLNIARIVAVMAGLPVSVAGATINRFCGSSMQSVHSAAGAIALGAGEAFVCGGVESMSRVPIMGFNPMPNPALARDVPGLYMSMGETAENVARRWQIPRAMQETFAVLSHRRAGQAQAAGRFEDEIAAIDTRDGPVAEDGCIRPETTPDSLAALKPAFDQSGSVTAGTSSPLTDGAAAVLVTTEDFALRHGLTPLAAIRAVAVSGCAPEIMGMGPVEATRKALQRAGLTVRDMDVVELNEAFASQALACIADLGLEPHKVNIDGGAIALGHPLGATGARIVGKAAALMKREGGRYALATQCVGGGQGIATVLEAL